MGCDIYSTSINKNSADASLLNKIGLIHGFKIPEWSNKAKSGCLGLFCGGGLYSLEKLLKKHGLKTPHFNADSWLPFEFKEPLSEDVIEKFSKINSDERNRDTEENSEFLYEITLLLDSKKIGSVSFLIEDLKKIAKLLEIPQGVFTLNYKQLKQFVKKHDIFEEETFFHSSWLDLYSQALYCQENNGILALSV